jgi:hypothetical protein
MQGKNTAMMINYTHTPLPVLLNYRFLGHDPVYVTWYICTKTLLLDEECTGTLTLITMVQYLRLLKEKSLNYFLSNTRIQPTDEVYTP